MAQSPGQVYLAGGGEEGKGARLAVQGGQVNTGDSSVGPACCWKKKG